jgi:anti-anti-sigma factor
VVTVSGELDVASSHLLEEELGKVSDAALVVVDLRGVTFIDSTGLGVLVRAHQRAQEQGKRIGFVRGNGQVERLLTLTGLDDELLVADSAEQLLIAE